MPQLDLFVFYDEAVTSFFFFCCVYFFVAFIFVPYYLRQSILTNSLYEKWRALRIFYASFQKLYNKKIS